MIRAPTYIIASLLLMAAALSASPAPEGVPGKAAEQAKGPSEQVAPEDVKDTSPDDIELLKAKAQSGNLLHNGGFEEGRYWPEGWEPVDRLGTFWIEGGKDGKKCVRLYTDLLDKQWVEWNEKVRRIAEDASKRTGGRPQSLPSNPVPEAPAPLPTSPPYYDTVGGLHGIHYCSQSVRVQPGAIYRFSVDARAETVNGAKGAPKVFLKGFTDLRTRTAQGGRAISRDSYRAEMTLEDCNKEWKHYELVFHPARSKSTYRGKPIQPEWLRVDLYAYWPVGTYEFDNARLEIVGHEKVTHHPEPAKEPSKEKEAAPPKTEERDDKDFSVFK